MQLCLDCGTGPALGICRTAEGMLACCSQAHMMTRTGKETFVIAAQASKYKTGAVWSHCPIFPLMLNIIQCSWGVLQRRLQTILVPRRFCCVPARKDWAGLQTEPFLSASAGISLLALGYLAAPASMGRCCHACDASPTFGLSETIRGARDPVSKAQPHSCIAVPKLISSDSSV